MSDPRYIIGIDLGTTNSVVAYVEAATPRVEEARIRIFDVPQLVDAGVVQARPVLPSFVLLPTLQEVDPQALALPWDRSATLAVGEFARRRGQEIPHRLIASAKSWLCNTLVDRRAAILPWESTGAAEQAGAAAKLSPVSASAKILSHLRTAWNDAMACTDNGADDALKMENQAIYLTVPASFDAVARELTVEAAAMAGLPQVTLLEEPQAAVYAWIAANSERWRDAVAPGDLVLVCDVGGGTSDFSLIQVADDQGALDLERIAVGNHLLVGGDNMDLTLAYALARQLAEKGKRLDTWQMNSLWHSCSNVKERILSDPDCHGLPVTVLGRGSSLIGGTLSTELTRETVERLLTDGFLPRCQRSDQPQSNKQAGIREFGLAYEADPAITRHLAAFLSRPAPDGRPVTPTAVLFNGGVMKSALLRKQVLDILNGWSPEQAVREIPGADLDLAVARGAACYGLARQGKGVRIRSGLGRSYYIGIAASMPAVPGMPAPTKALCVAPFGMEEGTTAAIVEREFVLRIGEPVVFDFLGSTTRLDDPVGTVVEDWDDQIQPVTTLETVLEGEAGQTIPVTLELHVTAVGTLELWCVSKTDARRWKLEWNVREQ
ncbi:MAG: Hsp70 family protein [Desulfatitalea sp.]|nr:Hsp70 family protein [Desulfatitalea sp.]NNK02202.1 Hsp70 family protein [Desulfatitalea sp.]